MKASDATTTGRRAPRSPNDTIPSADFARDLNETPSTPLSRRGILTLHADELRIVASLQGDVVLRLAGEDDYPLTLRRARGADATLGRYTISQNSDDPGDPFARTLWFGEPAASVIELGRGVAGPFRFARAVSRRHCLLSVQPEGIWLADHSKNGTIVEIDNDDVAVLPHVATVTPPRDSADRPRRGLWAIIKRLRAAEGF